MFERSKLIYFSGFLLPAGKATAITVMIDIVFYIVYCISLFIRNTAFLVSLGQLASHFSDVRQRKGVKFLSKY